MKNRFPYCPTFDHLKRCLLICRNSKIPAAINQSKQSHGSQISINHNRCKRKTKMKTKVNYLETRLTFHSTLSIYLPFSSEIFNSRPMQWSQDVKTNSKKLQAKTQFPQLSKIDEEGSS